MVHPHLKSPLTLFMMNGQTRQRHQIWHPIDGAKRGECDHLCSSPRPWVLNLRQTFLAVPYWRPGSGEQLDVPLCPHYRLSLGSQCWLATCMTWHFQSGAPTSRSPVPHCYCPCSQATDFSPSWTTAQHLKCTFCDSYLIVPPTSLLVLASRMPLQQCQVRFLCICYSVWTGYYDISELYLVRKIMFTKSFC